MDMRMGEMFSGIFDAIEELQANEKVKLDILFLDASNETLVKRFKETRRKHPLLNTGTVIEGIAEERRLLSRIEDYASNRLDTTTYSQKKLGTALDSIYAEENG